MYWGKIYDGTYKKHLVEIKNVLITEKLEKKLLICNVGQSGILGEIMRNDEDWKVAVLRILSISL